MIMRIKYRLKSRGLDIHHILTLYSCRFLDIDELLEFELCGRGKFLQMRRRARPLPSQVVRGRAGHSELPPSDSFNLVGILSFMDSFTLFSTMTSIYHLYNPTIGPTSKLFSHDWCVSGRNNYRAKPSAIAVCRSILSPTPFQA